LTPNTFGTIALVETFDVIMLGFRQKVRTNIKALAQKKRNAIKH
jgi:hypothetical protein